MKKKFLALILSFTMVMSMAACGGSDTDADTDDGSTASVSDDTDTSAQDTEDESVPDDEDENASESELVYNEVNGLRIALPADYEALDGGAEGIVNFANADRTSVITINGPAEAEDTPETLTEEFFAAIFEEAGDNITVDNVGAVEQPDGATAVVAFCSGSSDDMNNGEPVNVVMQYYFMADGSGIYILNYIYSAEDTATDDVITEILASVTVADE